MAKRNRTALSDVRSQDNPMTLQSHRLLKDEGNLKLPVPKSAYFLCLETHVVVLWHLTVGQDSKQLTDTPTRFWQQLNN